MDPQTGMVKGILVFCHQCFFFKWAANLQIPFMNTKWSAWNTIEWFEHGFHFKIGRYWRVIRPWTSSFWSHKMVLVIVTAVIITAMIASPFHLSYVAGAVYVCFLWISLFVPWKSPIRHVLLPSQFCHWRIWGRENLCRVTPLASDLNPGNWPQSHTHQ